ncbi:MAG: phosphodiester glycosidase family protein [Anaerolineales bacterium]|nr:phosphodiester glycosidase family protein [Anaerolineales bacterium]
MKKSRQWLSAILLVAILSRLILVQAQQPTELLSRYLQPGERVVTLQPALDYNGRLYQIHYFTTGDTERNDASVIGTATPDSFANQQIVGLLITVDDEAVSDEATIREIITVYRAAYFLYEEPIVDPLGFTDYYPFDDLRGDLRRITNNPIFIEQFIKGLFESRQDQVEEALRAIVTTQLSPPDNVTAFQDAVNGRVEQGQHLIDATDEVLEAARFSNDRNVRQAAASLRETFDSWTAISGADVEILGREVELLNALDLVFLTINLAHTDSYQQERIQWLDEYAGFGAGTAAFDEDQLQATETVLAEADSSAAQRKEIILDFIRDQSVDLGSRIATEELSRIWVKKSWETYGKRIAGHRAAGAASAVLLGFTLGNLLYGLDDLHSNFRVAERSNELREVFHNGRIQLQANAANQSDISYNGNLAARYQQVYMLESLAAAQTFRSYADGVDATVHEGLTAIINPINWFKGQEWREAADGLREVGNNLERDAESALGHPELVETAITLVKERLAVFAPPIGTCEINHSDGVDLHQDSQNDAPVHVVCIDLTDPYLRFETVMANDVYDVNPTGDQRETVASMVGRSPYQEHHPLVAFNADYFGADHGAEGFTVANGLRIDGPYSNDTDGNETERVSLSLSRLNQVELGFKSPVEVDLPILHLSRFYNSVGGGPTLINGGNLIADPCPKEGFDANDECRLAAQTAVGLSQDGTTLIVAVAESVNGEDMGRVLMRNGAYQGMKLDGGGSSQLWYRGDMQFSSDRPVANALLIFREEIPRHDAVLIEQSQYPVVQPGEPITLSLTVQNMGFLNWDPSLPYELKNVSGETFGLANTQPVPAQIAPGVQVEWFFSPTAPEEPGIYASEWQMVYRPANGVEEYFGPPLAFVVTVVPKGTSPDVIDSVQQLIDQAQEEARGSLEEFLDGLERAFWARLEAELRKLIPPEIQCLLGLSLWLGPITAVIWFGRRKEGLHG